ncbi:MAG TPA: cytochrome c oxidase subunit II [Gaiellaceae bacterium]
MTPLSRHGRLLPALGLVVLLAGCGGNENTLDPHSRAEGKITQIFWVVFGFSAFGFGVVVFLLFLGWWRRSKETLPFGGGEKAATGLVVGAGVALPIVLLVALFVYADLFAMKATGAPPRGSAQLTIDVTGHQFWWEVRYEGTSAVTANEIHVPTNTRVAIVTHTADVIHSFWIPELNRKMDMIPGQSNRVLIDATKPGVYAGHCAEFCGLQHAHMVVLVFAQPRAAFDRWLARESKPVSGSPPPEFTTKGCADCHQVRGTQAKGHVGPDLTHFASRTTLGAARLTNTRTNVAEWLRDPQGVKPGNKMPDLGLSNADVQTLTSYLESLR